MMDAYPAMGWELLGSIPSCSCEFIKSFWFKSGDLHNCAQAVIDSHVQRLFFGFKNVDLTSEHFIALKSFRWWRI
jgi:hypothetical protein